MVNTRTSEKYICIADHTNAGRTAKTHNHLKSSQFLHGIFVWRSFPCEFLTINLFFLHFRLFRLLKFGGTVFDVSLFSFNSLVFIRFAVDSNVFRYLVDSLSFYIWFSQSQNLWIFFLLYCCMIRALFFNVHHSSKLTWCVFILSGFLSLSILYQWNILTFCSHWFWKSARFQF